MKKMMIITTSFLLGAFSLHAKEKRPSVGLVASPQIQLVIQTLVDADNSVDQLARLETLRGLAAHDANELIRQLFHFSRNATDTRSAMVFGAVFARLKLSDLNLVDTMVPLLETRDPKLQEDVRNILAGIEKVRPGRAPDFSAYHRFFVPALREGKTPPSGLVAHLFVSDATQAVRWITSVHPTLSTDESDTINSSIRQVSAWIQHSRVQASPVVDSSETASALRTLARQEHWWARAYVARVLSEHPKLRQGDLSDALRSDTHSIVRQMAPLPADG